MVRRIFAASLAALFLVGTALQAGAAQLPVDSGALDAYLRQEFEKTHIPGMSVQIVSADEVLFSKTYGDCDSARAPFILGSLSKSFTAMAVMQLVEQGKLDLDRAFSDYTPANRADCQTTVRQLLNQTSGIATYETLENYESADTPAPYQYANVNYGLLGRVVERVSGMDYGAYLQAHIFAPLGMTGSYTSLEAAKQGGMADGHRNYFGYMAQQELPYPGGEIDGWLNLPSAYVISSAEDMGTYLQSYLRGGEGVLSAAGVDTMLYDAVDVQEDYRYGMGWGQYTKDDHLLLTHGGNVANYTTSMQILPELGLGVVVLFDACDYLVSNGLAVQLSNNLSFRLLGLETDDIGDGAYMRAHVLIDGIALAVLALSFLPLILYRKKRIGRGLLPNVIMHIVLPGLILTAFTISGIPITVVREFAPDVFMIQVISSAALLLTGVYKLAARLRAGKAA